MPSKIGEGRDFTTPVVKLVEFYQQCLHGFRPITGLAGPHGYAFGAHKSQFRIKPISLFPREFLGP